MIEKMSFDEVMWVNGGQTIEPGDAGQKETNADVVWNRFCKFVSVVCFTAVVPLGLIAGTEPLEKVKISDDEIIEVRSRSFKYYTLGATLAAFLGSIMLL